jgi:putative peptidoglycan lipid II flippase
LFLKSSAIFSILTFISRIFGFVRDVMLASYFGTTIFADAFAVAFKLPNTFRGIFAEGAFSAAFVPIFTRTLSSDGKDAALRLAGHIFSFLTVSLLVLIIALEISMPLVITLLAPGFETNPEKFELTIFLTYITTPYLFFISLVTFFSCILNSVGKFAAMAASPIILNLAMIVGMYFFGNNELEKVIATAWTVSAGGFIQLLVIVYFTLKRDMWPKISVPKFTEGTKRFFNNLGPATLGSSVVQINLAIGTIIATSIPGAIAMIYYADRLVQLPTSLIGVSIAIVILPSLSKYFKLKDFDSAIVTQNRALEIALLLSLPCMILLCAMTEPTVRILFQHGEFSASDTASTSQGLFMLSLGIPAYVMNKIMVPCFFAVEDTKTPVKISLINMVLNVTGSLILIRYFGYVGITMATTITAWINLVMLVIFAYKKEIFYFDSMMKARIPRLILSSIFLYVFLDAVIGLSSSLLNSDHRFISLLTFAAIGLAGCATYAYAVYLTKSYTIKDLKNLIH